VGRRIPRVTVPGFDYTARTAEKLEIPFAQRIAEIRARKADERARGRRNAERRSIGLSAPRGGRTTAAMGTHERPRSYQPLA
jgi:ATP-dependent RNA helicase RhlE